MSPRPRRTAAAARTPAEAEAESSAATIPAPRKRHDAAQAMVDRWSERFIKQPPAPRYGVTDDGHLVPVEGSHAPDVELDRARMLALSGMVDADAQSRVLYSLARVLSASTTPVSVDARGDAGDGAAPPADTRRTAAEHTLPHLQDAMGLLLELAPANGLESLLTTQMVANHTAIMELTRRALDSQADAQWSERQINQAAKLQRIFTEQATALAKLRGQGAQQTVRVVHEHRHVHVHGEAPASAPRSPATAIATICQEAPPRLTAGGAPDVDVAAFEAAAETMVGGRERGEGASGD